MKAALAVSTAVGGMALTQTGCAPEAYRRDADREVAKALGRRAKGHD